MHRVELALWVVPAQDRRCMAKARSTALLLLVERGMQAPAQIGWRRRVRSRLRALRVQAQQGTVSTLHRLLHRVPLQLRMRAAVRRRPQFALVRYQQLGCHRWRRCAGRRRSRSG